MNYSSETLVWREGDTSKPNPFFILILNNIALERPLGSARWQPDVAYNSLNDRVAFTQCAEYIY